MTPKYRLIYFNAMGIAEPIRYLFAYGKIPYEDCRLSYKEWLEYKPRTPFGQIPVIKINGKSYNQTLAICRYFAKKLNLLGKTDWDTFQTDIVVDTIMDFRLNYAVYFQIQDEKLKRAKLEDIKNIHNPYYFGKFENILKLNGGYFIKHQFTWADIFFAGMSEVWVKTIGEKIFANYPNLLELKNTVENQPNIKVYREKRPETLF